MTSNKITKSSSKIVKFLARYDMTPLKHEQFKLGAINNVHSHINYLQAQIDEYQTLIKKVRSLIPGELFIWNRLTRIRLNSYKPNPVIIRFDFIGPSNQPNITVLACEQKFIYQQLVVGRLDKKAIELNLQINDIKNWTPITAKDLPLYLHFEHRLPLFDEILKGTSQ
jgi:hypothetical protein